MAPLRRLLLISSLSFTAMPTRKYTIRLKPTKQQEAMFWRYAGTRRFVWNWALRKIKDWHAAGEKLDWNRLSRGFTVLRNETEWLAELNCHNTRSVLHDLKIAMQAFFKRVKHKISPPGFPRFKRRHDSQQGFFVPEHSAIKGRRLIIMRHKIRMMRNAPEGKVGAAVRIKTVAGKWYASLTVTLPDTVVTPVAPTNLVGIDIGLSKYAVISDGTVVENPRFFRQLERKLAHWQRKLCRQKKGSNRRTCIKKRIAKIHAGIANCRKHFSHLISKQVADTYDAVCIESHSLKGQARSRLAKSVHDAGHAHFRDCLAYKLPDRGKRLLEAEPYFKSTGMCHVCGHNAGTLPLSVRKWTCPGCQTVHDRDFAASKMLEHEGRCQVTADKL